MSRRKMSGVPKMDNAGGQVLETGLIRAILRLLAKRKAASSFWAAGRGNRLAAPGTKSSRGKA